MGSISRQEYPVNAGVPDGSILGPTLLYINGLPDVIYSIAIYADDTTLYSKCDLASDLWQQRQLVPKLELNLIFKTMWTGAGSGLLISRLGKIN